MKAIYCPVKYHLYSTTCNTETHYRIPNVQVPQTRFVIITRCLRAQKRAGTSTKRNSFDKLTLKFSAFMRAFIALKEELRLPNISGSIVWNLKKKPLIIIIQWYVNKSLLVGGGD